MAPVQAQLTKTQATIPPIPNMLNPVPVAYAPFNWIKARDIYFQTKPEWIQEKISRADIQILNFYIYFAQKQLGLNSVVK